MIFFVFYSLVNAQDSSAVYDQKLNLLRLELGIGLEPLFNESTYNLLIKKLKDAGIEDEQLQDGFKWGGGEAGFEAYLKNNIDRLISDLNLGKIEIAKSDTLKVDTIKKEKIVKKAIPDTLKKEIVTELEMEPVRDLSLDIQDPKKEQKSAKKANTKKSILSGLRIGFNFGKPLKAGVSLANHITYFDPMISVRSPLGIKIGPVSTSVGYEVSKFSFEAPADGDNLQSYYGSGSGPVLFFDISKIIKFGGDNFGKYFMVGTSSSDIGSGFVSGYDLNMFLGSLPISLSVSSRFNYITFTNGASTYWVSLSAGLGIDFR
tara:strand:- start:614 stop:1567 length:954 start_codon:yes stop_codon:yes gene_type:complete